MAEHMCLAHRMERETKVRRKWIVMMVTREGVEPPAFPGHERAVPEHFCQELFVCLIECLNWDYKIYNLPLKSQKTSLDNLR